MTTDYQVGDEITKYRPTPRPIHPEDGDLLPPIPPFSDRNLERDYVRWREKMRNQTWGYPAA